ncbi:hypothetical protein AGMMS49959_01170 [Planctomycetales bacterium]|nr:hypothetical protein AGMMS49959_01170 [Planctomycetales bacterium]
MRSWLITLGFCVGGWSATADEVLTNAEIAAMVEAGLSETIVKEKIATSANNFDISAAALIELKRQEVPETLIQTLYQAALANRQEQTAQIAAAIRRYATGSEAKKRAAYLYLKQTGDSAIPQLCEALTAAGPKSRAAAAALLAELGNREILPTLEELLTDPEPAVRHSAADGLRRLASETFSQSLTKQARAALRHQRAPLSGYVRWLGLTKDLAGAELIGRRLLQDADTVTRREAAWALGEIAGEAAGKVLADAARNDRDEKVRGAAVRALGKIARPENFDTLAELCRNAPALRGEALTAIGKYPAAQAAPFLLDALKQPIKPDERLTALNGLRELTGHDYGDDLAQWTEFLTLFAAEHAATDFNANVVKPEYPSFAIDPVAPLNLPTLNLPPQ